MDFEKGRRENEMYQPTEDRVVLIKRRQQAQRRNGTIIVFVFLFLILPLLLPHHEEESKREDLVVRFRLGRTAPRDRPPPSPQPPPPPPSPAAPPPPPDAPPAPPPPSRPPDSPAAPPAAPPPRTPPCAPPPAEEAAYTFGADTCATVACDSTEKLFGYGPLPQLACRKCRGCAEFEFMNPPSPSFPPPSPLPPPAPAVPPQPRAPPPTPFAPCSWYCSTFRLRDEAEAWCHREEWQFDPRIDFFVHTLPHQCQVALEASANHSACVCLNAPPPPSPATPPPTTPPPSPLTPPPPPLTPPPEPSAPPPLRPPYRPGAVRLCADTCTMFYYVVRGGSVDAVQTELGSDGVCDDGLQGSSSAQCVPGTDCSDCGERWTQGPIYPPPPP